MGGTSGLDGRMGSLANDSSGQPAAPPSARIYPILGTRENNALWHGSGDGVKNDEYTVTIQTEPRVSKGEPFAIKAVALISDGESGGIATTDEDWAEFRAARKIDLTK